MSVEGGPDIVNDGLVLYLDAGNTKSYPGSGTVWRDLSGNENNGTLTNGPTFNSDNGGSLTFDGSNDHISYINLNEISSNSRYSFSLFFNTNNTLIEKGVWFNGTNLDRHGGKVIDNLFVFRYIGSSQIVRTIPISTNQWQHITCVGDSTNAYLYKNGIESSTATTNGLYVYFGSGASRIGGGYTNIGPSYFNGNISQVQIYNRALTPQEILQNYNATKGRYGL